MREAVASEGLVREGLLTYTLKNAKKGAGL